MQYASSIWYIELGESFDCNLPWASRSFYLSFDRVSVFFDQIFCMDQNTE